MPRARSDRESTFASRRLRGRSSDGDRSRRSEPEFDALKRALPVAVRCGPAPGPALPRRVRQRALLMQGKVDLMALVHPGNAHALKSSATSRLPAAAESPNVEPGRAYPGLQGQGTSIPR